jgi:nitrogen fixation protein NifX
MTVISKVAAQRVALAARALEGVDPGAFTVRLAERLGLPIDEEKLKTVTVTYLRGMLIGESTVDDAGEPDQPLDAMKLAVRYLWGQNGDTVDVPETETPVEMAHGLRVAVASNTEENLDGHFGSALRYLIYQVDESDVRLIDVRATHEADLTEDKNTARAALIQDCRLLYVQSIGGPAAAKVVRAGVHPVKVQAAAPAREVLAQLQTVLSAPPPWLARAMGVAPKSLAKFATEQEDA